MKKRSLFVATAMLLVAVIVATSATYAWFTNVGDATATVEMGVSSGSSLEIAFAADGGTEGWKSSLSLEDATLWKDASAGIKSGEEALGDLYTATYTDNSTTQTGYEHADVYSKTIYFRSNKPQDVIINSGNISAPTTVKNTLVKYAQILVKDDALDVPANIFANQANTSTEAIVGPTLSDSNGKYTAKTLGSGTVIVNLDEEVQTDGYYHGSATFYFYIEGTETSNADLVGLEGKISASLTFSQHATANTDNTKATT